MTEAIAASEHVAPPDRSMWALVAIPCGLVVLNSLATWLWPQNVSAQTGIEIITLLYYGALFIQPVLFGLWTALGAGSIISRLLAAAPWLMLVFVAPGHIPQGFADIEQYEFVYAIAAGFVVFAASTILFLIFRRVTRFRILPARETGIVVPAGLQFSVRYLLGLVTVCALVLGMATQLKFKHDEPPMPTIFSGPGFFLAILVYGGTALTVAILPTIAIPLMLLHGRSTARAKKQAFLFWLVVSMCIVAFMIVADGPSDTTASHLAQTAGVLLLPQTGALLIGVSSALILRRCGWRLTRSQSIATSP